MNMIEHFHFMRPEWLLLLLPFGVIIWSRVKQQSAKPAWIQSLPDHLTKALLVGEQHRTQHLPLKILSGLSLIAIVLCAGPTWHRQASPFGEDLAPLVIVMDVSESMLQSDVPPSRLFRAKQKLNQLITMRDSGRTALVVYSGSAHTAMPLTQDIQVFKPLLESISTEIMPREGKFAEYALPSVHHMLAGEALSASVVLVTDGVSEVTAKAYQDYFDANPHQLIVYGIGSTSVKSDIPFERRKLSNFASDVNTDFVELTHDTQDLEALSELVESHSQMSAEQSQPWFDSGYALVWLILVPYLIWFRKGWLVQWCVIVLIGQSLLYTPSAFANDSQFMDLWLTKDQQGERLFEQEAFLLAAETFDDNHWKAVSFYMAGEFSKAQMYFMRGDNVTSQLGLAASLARQKEYVAARNIYQQILNDAPGNETATHNLALVEGIIKHINQFTEGQGKSNEQQSSRELGDRPQTTDGVTQEVAKELLIKEHLTANQILNDAAMNEKWMKRVQSDLADFLAVKFSAQLQKGDGTSAEWRIDE